MIWGKAAAAALASTLAVASAAAGPAVSNTNVKFIGLGGEAEMAGSSDTAWAGIAALTAPLGEKWGFQAEAGASGFGGDTGIGAAAHLFRRDPDKYLAGVFISHASIDDADLSATRFGLEGELYFETVSLLAAAGYQTSDDLGDGAFGGIELRVYATDDVVLAAGAAAQDEAAYGRFSAEWRIAPQAMPGVALRAEAAIGDDDFSSVMGGLTVYFGEDATLKDRHRKQDPESALFNLFLGLQAGAEAPPSAPPPPPPPSMS
jgi:hypothetical protein